MSTSRCILLDHSHNGDQHIPSFIDSIRLVLHDHEHVTLHTPRSCPHWRSTHPFLRRFDSPSTTWSWARHVAYSLIMPTLEINTSLPFLLPSIFSSIRVSSNESVLRIRWPKYWSFSFGTSPSNEYSGLIASRINWFDLLAVQGTLKSLLQHHRASTLWCSVFFMVQLSHPYTLLKGVKSTPSSRNECWLV